MWILSFLPDWVFHAITIAGALGTLVGFVLGMIPVIKTYVIPIRVISILLLSFGLFLEGGIADNQIWQARVKEVEAKLAEAEAKSAKENTKIVTKVVTKTQIVRTRGETITKYIDREIVKYDTKFAPGGECEIPKEFLKAHNDAAEQPK
jgi:uncharacterized membrane protein